MLKVGTEVTVFVRRKKHVCYVAGQHTVRRKGRNRELARRVTGDSSSLDRDTLVLVAKDLSMYCRVSPGDSSMKETGKSIPAQKAMAMLAEVKSAITARDSDRRLGNYKQADANGLDNARVGSLIEVQFRDTGWTEVEFAGFVPTSGNVRFIQHGRKRTIGPQYARPLQKQG